MLNAPIFGVLLAGIFIWRRNLVAGTAVHGEALRAQYDSLEGDRAEDVDEFVGDPPRGTLDPAYAAREAFVRDLRVESGLTGGSGAAVPGGSPPGGRRAGRSEGRDRPR